MRLEQIKWQGSGVIAYVERPGKETLYIGRSLDHTNYSIMTLPRGSQRENMWLNLEPLAAQAVLFHLTCEGNPQDMFS